MPTPRATSTIVLGLITLLAAACYQPASGDQAELSPARSAADIPTATPILVLPDPLILSVDTPTPGPRRTVTSAATPAAAAPAQVESTATPHPEPTAAPTRLPATPEPAATPAPAPGPPSTTISATPFTDADLVAAIVAIVARGLAYTPQAERLGCTGRAADVRHLDAPNGPPLTLWTYPTSDDLKADWVLPSSGAPQPTIAGCEIDGGWIYWYENLVIAFEPQAEWIPESATREAIVDAFFSLTR